MTIQPCAARAMAIPRPMPRPPPVTSATRLEGKVWRSDIRQCLVHRFEEEVIAPHHAFIHAEAFTLVVNAVLEDTFPTGSLIRQELRAAQRVEDVQRIVVI